MSVTSRLIDHPRSSLRLVNTLNDAGVTLTGQLALVTSIEELLCLEPTSLSNDPQAVAKINSLDPYLLQSCCNNRMGMTLLAMLRGAGVLEAELGSVIHNTLGSHANNGEPRSAPIAISTEPTSSMCLKSALLQLSIESFEVTSVETLGTTRSMEDSDYDADSLMDFEISSVAFSSTDDFHKNDYPKLDVADFKLRGAVTRLHEQQRSISDNLDCLVKKLQNLGEQNKRDLDYLHKVRQSGDHIRDRVCELRSEIQELEQVFEGLKQTKRTSFATATATFASLNNSSHAKPPASETKALSREQNKPDSSTELQSEEKITLQVTDGEPADPLRFFINSTIFVLFVACWI